MSAAEDGNFERIDPPRYVAFRKVRGTSTLAVIASVEARDRCGYQLGRWFSERTPHGVFRNVPVDADSYGIDESVAEDLIGLIRNGQPLPPGIVRLMPAFPTNVGRAKI
jgi:hypothetical protein